VRIALLPLIGFAYLCLTVGFVLALLLALALLAALAWVIRQLWIYRVLPVSLRTLQIGDKSHAFG